MAIVDGADTATSIGMPATRAFCTSSNDARPLTHSTCEDSGSAPLQQHPADDLVDGVVSAHVLGDLDQRAVDGEQAGRMQSARAVEHGLLRPQAIGQARHDRRRYRPGGSDRCEREVEGVGRLASADAARRRRGDVASPGESSVEPRECLAAQRHVDRRLVVGLGHRVDVGRSAIDLLGEEEAGREVAIGARRPHRHDERLPVQADLERRFGGGAVLGDRALAVADALHLDGPPGAGGIAHAEHLIACLRPTAYSLQATG